MVRNILFFKTASHYLCNTSYWDTVCLKLKCRKAMWFKKPGRFDKSQCRERKACTNHPPTEVGLCNWRMSKTLFSQLKLYRYLLSPKTKLFLYLNGISSLNKLETCYIVPFVTWQSLFLVNQTFCEPSKWHQWIKNFFD